MKTSDVRKRLAAELRDRDVNVVIAHYGGDRADPYLLSNTPRAFVELFRASSALTGPPVLPVLHLSEICSPARPCARGASEPDEHLTPWTDRAAAWIIGIALAVARDDTLRKWAKISDRDGKARYAIQLAETDSAELAPNRAAEADVARALDAVATEVKRRTGSIEAGGLDVGYVLSPDEAHADRTPSLYAEIPPTPRDANALTDCRQYLGIVPDLGEQPDLNLGGAPPAPSRPARPPITFDVAAARPSAAQPNAGPPDRNIEFSYSFKRRKGTFRFGRRFPPPGQ